MTYIPPAGDVVNFNLKDFYSPPVGDAINFYLFEGPLGYTYSMLGNLGELCRINIKNAFGFPVKRDLLFPLGASGIEGILIGLGIPGIRNILLGLGETIEYLLHIPLAQTERQQVVNHLSGYLNDIQILINSLIIGDPLSGKQDLFTSLQAESGILSLHNQLCAVSTGLQKVLNILSIGDPFADKQNLFSSLQSDARSLSLNNELSESLEGLQKLISALTDGFVSKASFINELALKNNIQSVLTLLGSMPDPTVLYPDCTLSVYLDGLPINNQITDLSFVMDREVTFDVLSFSSSDVQLYVKLQEIVGNKDSALEIQYKGTSWLFLIEEVSGCELSYNVWGRSIAAAKSDAPFEDSVNFVLETDTLASVVAEGLVPNLSVTWNVVDWTILADWSVDGTPIQMLKELASSVGAVVRSYPDGTGLYVDEKYTIRPVDLLYAVSVEDYDRDIELMSLDVSRDLGTGANAVTVHGHSPFSKYSIRLEAENCVDVGNPAIIKVYPALGGIGYKLIASDGAPVYQHSLSEEHVEIVNFEGGKGSVRYPIISLKSITWDGVVPAGFEYTAGQDEIVLTDDTLAAVGEVVYSTRFDVWYGTHSGEGHLLVVCYLDEGGGIVAKVYFGEGDREADDIDRPILTSIEAAMAAGQAFLDDTSYNRLLRAINVPCSNVSDGDVISIFSDLSGVTGSTFVLKHEISASVDNEALKVISNLNVVQFEV